MTEDMDLATELEPKGLQGLERPLLFKRKKKKAAQERLSLFDRPAVGAAVQLRSSLSDNYEPERSGREKWWRKHIRETPLPGAYDPHEWDSFLLDLKRRPQSYRFKTDGRKQEVNTLNKGEYLLPGKYNFSDLTDELAKKTKTYSFQNTAREDKDMLSFGTRDLSIDVAPNQYNNEQHGAIFAEKGIKTASFKSAVKRFPTVYFKPKDGPAPGHYKNTLEQSDHPIRSSFTSSTARFRTSHTKVPGPGTYTSTMHTPRHASLEQMGRQHGLFFTCSFQP